MNQSSFDPRKERWTCEKCNIYFHSWHGLQKHKEAKLAAGHFDHIYCEICGQDFSTESAHTLHVQQLHPEEQKLLCAGCGHGPFVRLGGLISHIEHGKCPRITPSVFAEMRDKKISFAKNLGASSSQPIKHDFAEYVIPQPDANCLGLFGAKPDTVSFALENGEFPALDSTVGTQSDENQRPSSAAGKQLVKTPAEPKTEDRAAASRLIAVSGDEHHPENPTFNVGRYWCKFSERYVCPKMPCGKTFDRPGKLVGHLRGSAHGPQTWRCPACLKLFKSLTAITMHAETTNSCRVRRASDYVAYLSQLTAGIVDVDLNRNDDGTLAYKINKETKAEFQATGIEAEETPKAITYDDPWSQPAKDPKAPNIREGSKFW